MKEIKREDLIIGEIYTQYFDNYNYVFLMTNNNTHIAVTKSNIFQRKFMKYWNSNNFTKLMTEATPEEKHWFETCIKEDKFVSYEDAMKSFKPEFVLPEKWCIKTTNMDQEAKNWFLNKQKFLGFGLNYYGNCPFHDTENLNNFGGLSVRFKPNFPNVEITLEQFKKYVLNKKEEVMETPKNKIIKSTSKGGIRRIDSVECSEGGVYKIGDKITVFTKNSPHKGKVFTIRGFRWNNAKTNICAITELHTLNGIGLDKIELYIEPKVKDTFVLPEKWCIKHYDSVAKYIIKLKNDGSMYFQNLNLFSHFPPHDSLYCHYNILKGYTEITLEQFKKYVLKEKAEEYILMNKPCLSIKDVSTIYKGINKKTNHPSSQANRLKELVREKLK